MPKIKKTEEEIVKKPVIKTEEEADEEKGVDADAALSDELIPGEPLDDEENEDGMGMDDEEVDPFKDKWEE